MPGVLDMWTIYDHPADYPDHFVVRRFAVSSSGPRATDWVAVADTLEQARRALPPGLYRLPRQDDDEPVIVETWV